MRIIAFKIAFNNVELTIEQVKNLLKDLIKEKIDDVTIDFIKQRISKYFNIKIDELKSTRRNKELVLPRQIGMYLAKKFTNSNLITIAENFGKKDHGTVIYSCKVINKLVKESIYIKETINDLEEQLKKC